jgi:hypothetical protein
MNNGDVCKEYINGDIAKGNNLFVEGNILYSYGYHFPLAIRLILGKKYKFIINSDKYSVTTSKHKFLLLNKIDKEDIIKECNTQEMQKIKQMNITEVKELVANNL